MRTKAIIAVELAKAKAEHAAEHVLRALEAEIEANPGVALDEIDEIVESAPD